MRTFATRTLSRCLNHAVLTGSFLYLLDQKRLAFLWSALVPALHCGSVQPAFKLDYRRGKLAACGRAHLMRMQRPATLKQFATAWKVTTVHLKYRDPPLGICHAVDFLCVAAVQSDA